MKLKLHLSIVLIGCSSLLGTNLQAENLFSESFDGLTEGSQTQTSTYPINSSDESIPDKYFQTPGWGGLSVYQAGGCCAIKAYLDPTYGLVPGFIRTPMMNIKNGGKKVIFKLKAKAASTNIIILDPYSSEIEEDSYLGTFLLFREDSEEENPVLDTQWRPYASEPFLGSSAIYFEVCPYDNPTIFIDDLAVVDAETGSVISQFKNNDIVTVSNNRVQVIASKDCTAQLYNVSGQLLETIKCEVNTTNNFNYSIPGIYIVKLGNSTFKIKL